MTPAATSAPTHASQPNIGLGLAIHTTTPQLGLALGNQAETLKWEVETLGRAMSHQLQTRLMAFIKPYVWTELSFLAVARGPGGFTGTRLGIVTTRTLAQQLNIPLYGISTLAAMAHRYWTEGKVPMDQAIALDMRAQRGQRFVAIYRCNAGLPEAIRPDQVSSPEDWAQTLAEQTKQPFTLTVETEDPAEAIANLWQIAQLRYEQGDRPGWETATPFYGQHPVTL